MDLDFSLGNQVSYEGKIYKIKQALDLSKILLQELDSGNTVVAKVSKVIPIEAVTEKSEEQEISLIDNLNSTKKKFSKP